MVVKEDGSKWACRTCLLGHRVSSCDHTGKSVPLSLHTTAESLRVQTVNSSLYLGKVAPSANANIVVSSGRDDLPMSNVNVEQTRSLGRDVSTNTKLDPRFPNLLLSLQQQWTVTHHIYKA